MESLAFVPIFLGIAGAFCGLALPIAILVGLGVYIYRRRRMRDAAKLAAQDWASTAGVVISSTIKVTRTVKSRSETPVIVYEYAVDGQSYTGSRVKAGDQFFAVRFAGDARKTVERYAAGTPVTVFYNPENPGESALER